MYRLLEAVDLYLQGNRPEAKSVDSVVRECFQQIKRMYERLDEATGRSVQENVNWLYDAANVMFALLNSGDYSGEALHPDTIGEQVTEKIKDPKMAKLVMEKSLQALATAKEQLPQKIEELMAAVLPEFKSILDESAIKIARNYVRQFLVNDLFTNNEGPEVSYRMSARGNSIDFTAAIRDSDDIEAQIPISAFSSAIDAANKILEPRAPDKALSDASSIVFFYDLTMAMPRYVADDRIGEQAYKNARKAFVNAWVQDYFLAEMEKDKDPDEYLTLRLLDSLNPQRMVSAGGPIFSARKLLRELQKQGDRWEASIIKFDELLAKVRIHTKIDAPKLNQDMTVEQLPKLMELAYNMLPDTYVKTGAPDSVKKALAWAMKILKTAPGRSRVIPGTATSGQKVRINLKAPATGAKPAGASPRIKLDLSRTGRSSTPASDTPPPMRTRVVSNDPEKANMMPPPRQPKIIKRGRGQGAGVFFGMPHGGSASKK